jgi:hypothetical protein
MSTCFYDTNLTDAAWAWVAPLLCRSWSNAGVWICESRSRDMVSRMSSGHLISWVGFTDRQFQVNPKLAH